MAAIIYGVNTAISAILGILTVLKHIQLRKEITVVATDKSVELLSKLLSSKQNHTDPDL